MTGTRMPTAGLRDELVEPPAESRPGRGTAGRRAARPRRAAGGPARPGRDGGPSEPSGAAPRRGAGEPRPRLSPTPPSPPVDARAAAVRGFSRPTRQPNTPRAAIVSKRRDAHPSTRPPPDNAGLTFVQPGFDVAPLASSPWRNPALHRERRGARLTRRDEGEYWAYLTEEQRSQAGCIAARMQRGLCRVDDWRGGGRRLGGSCSRRLSPCAGASLPAMAPFPVAAHR